MKRLISFDYIRAISIIGIVLCHCCYGLSGLAFVGSFLGTTFNVVFLTLSAFLLGLSWEKRGKKAYGLSFLTHRISKLAYSYYPFLLVMFAFLAFTGFHVTIKDWLMHFLFLPWFDKLPGFGHLWFITMIVICYLGVFFVSRFQIVNKCKMGGVILAVLSQCVLGRFGLPNYMFLYLFLYVMVFLNAKQILEYVGKLRISTIAIVGGLLIAGVLYLFYANMMNKYTSVWGGMISAISFFMMSYLIFKNANENKVIGFISSISFEIYLVHHVFCFGQFSLFKVVENPILGMSAILLLSVALAYPLHLIGNGISIIVNRIGEKQ